MRGKGNSNNTRMDEQANFGNLCQNNYDQMKRVIVSAMQEGVEKRNKRRN